VTDIDTSIRQGLGYLVDSAPLAPTFDQVREQIAPTTSGRRIGYQFVVAAMAVVGVAGVIVGLSLSSSPSTQSNAPRSTGHSPLVDPKAGNGGFTVVPSTDLANGQSVAITVHGLNPHERLLILMCRGTPASLSEAQTRCDLDTAMSSSTDAHGNTDVAYKVHRFLNDGDFRQVDCATYAGGCSIGLGDYFNLSRGGATGNVEGVSFAPGPVNPSSVTSISTSPGAPFTDGEQIELVGRGFPANTPLDVAQCPVNADCSPLFVTVQSSADGTFSTTLTIRQSLVVSGQTFDCSSVKSCYLLAQTTQQSSQSTIAPTVAPPIPISVRGAENGA
jgi:hypothetical protein